MTMTMAYLFFVTTIIILSYSVTAFPFKDVSRNAGLDRSIGPQTKYGGASVADLNGDGYPDLLFGHHTRMPIEMYINNGDGTFSKQSKFNVQFDTHGINPFRFTKWDKTLHFSISRGGAFGRVQNAPQVYFVENINTGQAIDSTNKQNIDYINDTTTRQSAFKPVLTITKPRIKFTDVTNSAGVSYAKGRGRSAVYMNLGKTDSAITDVIFTNAKANKKFNGVLDADHQKAMKGRRGSSFSGQILKGFSRNTNWYVTYGDIMNDGRIDLIAFQRLQIYRLANDFTLRDMTKQLLPPLSTYQQDGVVAVSILDYDNDGKWDMYVARTNTGDLKWIKRMRHFDDYLLRYVEDTSKTPKRRKLVDMSKQAGIPTGWNTRGVTSGDFNNDGWVDIIISRRDQQDLLLLNNGDGTFKTVDAGFNRATGVPGDMVTAVDYDMDGRLDVIVSEGAYADKDGVGFYRLMRNIGNHGRALLVRVGRSRGGQTTSTHAVVKVVREDGLKMMRMVGSPGTAVSNSLIETVHFGLAETTNVRIEVTWTDGSKVVKDRIRLRRNQRTRYITVGWGF